MKARFQAHFSGAYLENSRVCSEPAVIQSQRRTTEGIAIFVGICVGALGPLLRHGFQPQADNALANYFDFVDLYLWPTHLLAWGDGSWGVISLIANLAFFGELGSCLLGSLLASFG